jgi:DNA-binding transcriptional LysR family regulator
MRCTVAAWTPKRPAILRTPRAFGAAFRARVSSSRMRYFGAVSHGNASLICRANHSAHVVLRTNGIQSHVAVVEEGEAMAVLPRVLGDRRPAFVRIEPPLPEPFQPVKIGVHADMRDTPRIRSLIDYLVRELKARAAELNPSQTA